MGLFDFGSGSGRVWPKSSGFGSGSGIVHILVSRLILLTLCVILQGASKKSFSGLIQIGPSYQWVNFKCLTK